MVKHTRWFSIPADLVNLEQQDRHEPGLPVVAVDHVGALVGLEHELQRRLAEKGEPHARRRA